MGVTVGGTATFAVGDATELPTDVADVVVSALALNFFPDVPAALASMRAAAPHGLVAAYVWDYAGRMDLIRALWDAAVELDPAAAALDEGARFPICRPDALEAAWREAGCREVESVAIDVPTVFADFDDFWRPFLAGTGPAPAYVVALSPDRRGALRKLLRSRLPIAPDGTIAMNGRAWAVRGRSAAGGQRPIV